MTDMKSTHRQDFTNVTEFSRGTKFYNDNSEMLLDSRSEMTEDCPDVYSREIRRRCSTPTMDGEIHLPQIDGGCLDGNCDSPILAVKRFNESGLYTREITRDANDSTDAVIGSVRQVQSQKPVFQNAEAIKNSNVLETEEKMTNDVKQRNEVATGKAIDVIGQHDVTDPCDATYLEAFENMSQTNQQLISTDERWKIIFSEQSRAPQFAVCHYVNYLKRLVDVDKGNKLKTKKLKDGIHPVSYLLRKLKVDLKVSYESFVSDFIRAPNNGLQLLLKLLHQLQNTSRQKSASVANKETRLEEFKRQLADELDCLLCVKFTLRCQDAVDRLVGDGQFLRVVCGSLLSNTIKSRIVTLEILTLCLGAKTGFDRVFEMFTWMRINFGEAVRFKLLVSMMFTRAYSQTLFQVTTMRFLNTLLAASGTGNLRVYLQQEVEMAGLDVDILDKFTRGDGLEFDELRREIEEWKLRYIDVDSLLKSPKPDIWSKEERWRYSTRNLGIDQHGYHDNTDELSPRPYPYGSRELPPISSMTDIPANSLQLLMSLIHRQKQAEKNDIMQAMKEQVSPPCNHGNQQHPNVTIDYNSGGQELYLAHVYKNTGEMDSEDCLNRPPLKSDQHRRYSHDPSQHRRKTRQETENIYETLNWRSASITKDYSDTCTNGMVTRQRGCTKRLGSLNGNWVLRTHLSMPSLSTIDNPNLSLAQSKDSPSRDETDEPPNDQTSTEPQPSVTYHTLEPEPEPDYSPEVSPNATLHKNDADVQQLLNDFDKMLEQHDTRPKTLTGRQTEYIKSGTITFV